MSSRVQQQATQRKLIYIAVIVALLAGSYGFRHYVVEREANRLALLEQNRGDVELTASAVRLALTGSRGLAVCALWQTAIEKQKKNQWNELELLVRSVTRLQPHFIRPWLFQSWNLAYNVSVECHDLRDMYFYITRGVELLAEGERQNRHNPELRYNIGFTCIHKINLSDKTSPLRSMFQLSMINPVERDPARFYEEDSQGRRTINMAEFQKFCQDHPQLVRRLKEGLNLKYVNRNLQFRCETPEALVQFLEENRKVPGLYEELKEGPYPGVGQPTALKPFERRFPQLPPPPAPGRRPEPPQQLFDPTSTELTYESRLGDEIDAYGIARSWYGYAQEPLPPPARIPGELEPVTNRVTQRNAPYTTMIFRTLPARAQSYVAERLEEEGWFDEEGWLIPDWFSSDPPRVGGGVSWAQDAWSKAYNMWATYGEFVGVIVKTGEEESRLETLAERYRSAYGLDRGSVPLELKPEDRSGPLQECFDAYSFLHWSRYYRAQTNFNHHYFNAQVEAKPEAVLARKLFFEARQNDLLGLKLEAIEKYDEAIPRWRQLLLDHAEFRNDSIVQEDTYEVQLRYLRRLQELRGTQFKRARGELSTILSAAGALPLASLATYAYASDEALPPVEFAGPFDVNDSKGNPLIPEGVREIVLMRRPGYVPKGKGDLSPPSDEPPPPPGPPERGR